MKVKRSCALSGIIHRGFKNDHIKIKERYLSVEAWEFPGLDLRPCRRTASRALHRVATHGALSVANCDLPPNLVWQAFTAFNKEVSNFCRSSSCSSCAELEDSEPGGMTADIIVIVATASHDHYRANYRLDSAHISANSNRRHKTTQASLKFDLAVH
jgi:hypothetical protein